MIEMPPLSARPADIAMLAKHFAASVPRGGRARPDLSGDCLRLLENQEWPGNVRELRHAVEAAVLLSERTIIGPADVRRMLRGRAAVVEEPAGQDFPQARLVAILRAANWDTRRAAEQLGIHRATLYRHMRRLGVRKATEAARGASAAAQPRVIATPE